MFLDCLYTTLKFTYNVLIWYPLCDLCCIDFLQQYLCSKNSISLLCCSTCIHICIEQQNKSYSCLPMTSWITTTSGPCHVRVLSTHVRWRLEFCKQGRSSICMVCVTSWWSLPAVMWSARGLVLLLAFALGCVQAQGILYLMIPWAWQ